MTKVKMCGFQTADAVLAAAEAGADAIGLVFVRSARRALSLDAAEALLNEFRSAWGSRPPPEIVGLFGDQPAEEVNAAVARLGLDSAQLCGAEGMAYCAEMTVPLYKVIGVEVDVPVSVILPKIMVLLQRHDLAGHGLVLDAKVGSAYGGTGQSFDWGLAAGLSQSFRLSLAGGLNPENVGEAVRTARPWGVDTSSGIETDGEKDPERIRAFIQAVREADNAASRRGLRKLFSRS